MKDRVFGPIYTCLFILILLPCCALASDNLTSATSSLFGGSGTCTLCHISNGTANTDSQGMDVSQPDDWRSTMMANAMRDPVFRATVEAEVLRYPALRHVIEDKCLTCHAPMYRTQLVYDGLPTTPTMTAGYQDPLGQDGVSCTLCHQIQPDNLGQESSFSGGYIIKDERIIFGPYNNMQSALMIGTVNYDAQFGAHKQTPEVCATCHTLFTPTLDYEGNIVGVFAEQTAYLEWQNSIYGADDTSEEYTVCQDCHMPRVEEDIILSVIPHHLPGHSPYWKHYFVGGNSFMLSLLKDNIDVLDLKATEEQFDTTIARTLAQLNFATDLTIQNIESRDSAVALTVNVKNNAGHKLPTGYPSRRLWLHVKVTDESESVAFESGAWDEDGEIVGLDADFEPHRDVISAGDQVQIYEGVTGDINDQVTHTLLRSANYLKDNRIPPRGFLPDGPNTSITKPVGAANADDNFNKDAGNSGTGSDLVTYLIPLEGVEFPITIEAELVYQSLAPRFVEAVLEEDAPIIDEFESLYAPRDKSPVITASVSEEFDYNPPTRWLLY